MLISTHIDRRGVCDVLGDIVSSLNGQALANLQADYSERARIQHQLASDIRNLACRYHRSITDLDNSGEFFYAT